MNRQSAIVPSLRLFATKAPKRVPTDSGVPLPSSLPMCDCVIASFCCAAVFAGNVTLPLTDKLNLHEPAEQAVMPCYRGVLDPAAPHSQCFRTLYLLTVMNPDGTLRPGQAEPTLAPDQVLKSYKLMVRLRVRAPLPQPCHM